MQIRTLIDLTPAQPHQVRSRSVSPEKKKGLGHPRLETVFV
jgi:hypothetical protein